VVLISMDNSSSGPVGVGDEQAVVQAASCYGDGTVRTSAFDGGATDYHGVDVAVVR
jgi:hypothetical protein